jgi:hypothetical protein
MSYKTIVISSGHGKYVRGASGILDEVDEARRVVEAVAENLSARGAHVSVFHDDVSKTQDENLKCITDYHNSQSRQLDISVHFNAYVACSGPMGCEVLYQSQSTLAGEMSLVISNAGKLKNRGPKRRTDLYFLNNTDMPAILIETCFVDSQADADLYRGHFEGICQAIAVELKDVEGEIPPAEVPQTPLLLLSGKASYFGGPDDLGVSSSEGLAFIYSVEDAPAPVFAVSTGRHDGPCPPVEPDVHYIATRWDYNVTPSEVLLNSKALVRAEGGIELTAFPADWGPHTNTGRVADLSPGLMGDLGITTDDEVEVIFPA